MRRSLVDVWNAYLDAEGRGLRAASLSVIEELIKQLSLEDPDIRRRWVFELVEGIVDSRSHAKIRFPLFEQSILPELTAGVLSETPNCARWLAHFNQHFQSSKRFLQLLPDSMRTKVGLLLEALRVDPTDNRARRTLTEERARYLTYTLHELPAGVLYGNDAATISECRELDELLGDFQKDIVLLEEPDIYSELIDACTFHFERYRRYLEAGCPGRAYRFYASMPEA